ncbi:hemerythrin domain-containing protein [Sphingobium sp. BYY-5]|uniref:hemerythrin domain-containing protein n=1 Tax=Sphingobium sp. BYY-5 TaxID=2926400 RepID=UPI001FA76F32|nr:hemerythrin domain-containing protein [Sphingobium sp. BYY-5]MCI4588555.1 hemerythrin domain-containing protein [Sphingobium sp. BYY-5]
MDLSDLRRQHEEIGLTAQLLTQAISDDRHPQGVAKLRWQLARQLMTHLALEDRIFYPALMRSTNPVVRERTMALQKEIGALSDRFAVYMASWSDDRIAHEWPGFCVETRSILDALSARIDCENRILYPLAQAVGDRTPPAAPSQAASS